MRHLPAIAMLTASLFVGCGPQKPPAPALKSHLNDVIERQRNAFANGTCVLREAWNYTGPLPYAERSTNAFLGIVVELSGFTDHFDFDDIDLIDADSGENLGSDPEIWPVKADGTADAKAYEFPKAPGPAKVFLLYERAKLPKTIKLEYWRKPMGQPVAVANDGRAMFKGVEVPKAKSKITDL